MRKVVFLSILVFTLAATLSGCTVKDIEVEELLATEKPAAEATVEPTATPETFTYVDSAGEEYVAVLNQNVEKNHYDWTKLDHEMGSDDISYDDGDYKIRKGVDVSHHNGTIDWEKVKAAGYDFAILRLGYRGYGKEGKVLPDREFQSSFKAARRAGMELGVYFFSQAITEDEALEEAEFVLTELNNSKLELPVVYDPELIPDDDARTDGISGEQFTKNTIAFCERIREAGYEPMVYSNLYWEARLFELDKLNDYPLWYADYQAVPQTPYRFTYWQYSESGKVDGIPGDADLDVVFERK